MSLESLTLEQFKASRPDLANLFLQEQQESETAKAQAAEIKTMREQLDAYKAKEAVSAKREIIERLITESKIPVAAVTDVFRGILLEAKDEAAIKVLIEDRKTFVGSGKTFAKPTSTDKATGSGDKLRYYE